MRNYELMVILDPNLDERTVAPSLDTFLRVVTGDGGTVEKVDIWGKRRMAYEILKNAEGIYAVLDVVCEPATVAELDRQLSLNESVLRTKVMRREVSRRSTGAPGAASRGAAAVAGASTPASTSAAAGPAAVAGASGSAPRTNAPANPVSAPPAPVN
jgi:small subunit ribosomal protein S6